ncbi:hypothetical protein GGH92_011000 [Coemansia sp. RSA 2673]|nr:hypothetical protein GGH92_011000 [Coemansia sp. RSA 2673]
MSLASKFGAPAVAALAGVCIATYTFLPVLREQRDSQARHHEEIQRVVADAAKHAEDKGSAEPNAPETKPQK